MNWTNFWHPTVHVLQYLFEKNLIKVGRLHLHASFGTFLRTNRPIVCGTVSLWRILEHRQIVVSNSFECSKTRYASNNWPIWTKKVPKEALAIYQLLLRVLKKIFVVHELCSGPSNNRSVLQGFILVVSTVGLISHWLSHAHCFMLCQAAMRTLQLLLELR